MHMRKQSAPRAPNALELAKESVEASAPRRGRLIGRGRKPQTPPMIEIGKAHPAIHLINRPDSQAELGEGLDQ